MRRDRKKGPAPAGEPEAKRSSPDREALRDAFAGVEPLRGKKKRVMPEPSAPPSGPTRAPRKRARSASRLSVARDPDGFVVAQRPNTHPSILETLESPHLDIQDECDLHGLTVKEAERAVLGFIRRSRERGHRWLLVIVGKGLHSPRGEATLRDHVIHTLSAGAASEYVLAFRSASRRHGGSGALAVRLLDPR